MYEIIFLQIPGSSWHHGPFPQFQWYFHPEIPEQGPILLMVLRKKEKKYITSIPSKKYEEKILDKFVFSLV